ncbi:NAD-dependent epimerase/dehydratase family protein [Paeniglutamicibacter gangotriensis]|uniref:NAD-dependent epimerase/dehydratase family protein n=1 Tax=Paeniglutamicibacter gangotriensis TaxID=254787 RepID=A0A5B0EDZ7_9MICC|nr:NAD(P)H-binding protein [Paeniglutamicibacter gangotriensis]KAA0976071.1 NAD-dependent epimerase/dehydratase family protein [Paeniglutamicibacter gangotriensis]
MKIAVYGATGMVGSQIVAEAAKRGHEITAVSRSGRDVPGAVTVSIAELGDSAAYRALAGANDVVVFSIPPSRTGESHQPFIDAHEEISETLVPARVFVVGGAGATEVDGVRLVNTPGFPEDNKAEALTMGEVLDFYTSASGLDWTMLAPAPVIAPGEPTGTIVLGNDSPAGERVSTGDFAVAALDEIEEPRHQHRRFTVASA